MPLRYPSSPLPELLSWDMQATICVGPLSNLLTLTVHNKVLITKTPYTVKRVDEVVRHPHLVTQDQNTQVSKKVSNISEENFTINIELLRHFSQVSN
jgi:hypothetical protein